MVARKEGNQWLLLNGNNAWTDIGIRVRQEIKNQMIYFIHAVMA